MGPFLTSWVFQYTIPGQEETAKAAIFHFESICVLEKEGITGTETTRWIEKHTQTAVSISSNLRPDPVVLSSSKPREFITSFVDALENLST